MDLSFLDNINIESENKTKAIRFSEDEAYLLKFLKYQDMKFTDYIKMLIHQDLEKHVALRATINRDEIRKIIKMEMKKLR